MTIPRGMPLDAADPLNKSTVVKNGDRVLLIDDLVATGGTLSSGIELVRRMGATVVECACVVELKMFVDPPAESGLPSRTKSWTEKGIADVPVWGLISKISSRSRGRCRTDMLTTERAQTAARAGVSWRGAGRATRRRARRSCLNSSPLFSPTGMCVFGGSYVSAYALIHVYTCPTVYPVVQAPL